MKKLMILGASYSLVPLITAAKRCGYHTVVTSIPGEYPGFALADEVCYEDITDPERVLQAADLCNADGVATCCMDVGLRSLGYVNTRRGLRGPSWETVQKCTDKYLMKRAFLEAGVRTARFYQISGAEELAAACDRLQFPVILKAVDQMGSRGIYRCDTREEVFSRYPDTMSFTSKDYCILEEFLVGTMFGVEAMLEGTEIAYLAPVGNDLHNGNPPFPIGHYLPWENTEKYEEQIREQIRRAAQALGASDCPMDFDMMLKDGEVYIIEATARAGATCLAELVSIHYGIDYYEVIARLAMGEPVSSFFQREKEQRTACAARLLEAERPGRVRELAVEETGEGVVDCSFNVGPGDRIRLMENGRDRIGQAIVQGADLRQCRERMAELTAAIRLEVEDD